MSAQAASLAVRKAVTVHCPVEQAFETFTEGIASWWPLETHSVAAEQGKEPGTAILEGRVGGRLYERMADGGEAPWAEVTAWEPPHRLVLSWQVNPQWPARTEIEVRFTEEGEGTRVEVVHTGWERLGELAERAHANYDGGWPTVLGRFAEAASA